MSKTVGNLVGLKFGRLTVVGRSDWLYNNGKKRTRGWRLVCECGTEVSLVRGAFDPANPQKRKQLSCGCLRKESSAKLGQMSVKNYKGIKIGRLTAIEPTERRAHNDSVVWVFQCECKNLMQMCFSEATRRQKLSKNLLSCGSSVHTDRFLHYPETPNPYPREAGLLMAKYLKYLEPKGRLVYAEAIDERIDALIRVCWVITYRRSAGEIINEKHEKGLILKWMRYGKIKAFQKFLALKYAPRQCVNLEINKSIGDVMTNLILPNYPDGNKRGNLAIKRRKFKRC